MGLPSPPRSPLSLLHRLFLPLALLWVRSLRPRFAPASPHLPDSGILVLWHEHMLPCLAAFQKRDMRVLISASADGDFGARAAERLGYRAVRGSTSRGGAAALRALATELAREGGWVAIVADGPRGPRRRAKPGAAWLAERTGLPLFGAVADCPRGFTLNSWDRCRVPLPFSKVRLRVTRLGADIDTALR